MKNDGKKKELKPGVLIQKSFFIQSVLQEELLEPVVPTKKIYDLLVSYFEHIDINRVTKKDMIKAWNTTHVKTSPYFNFYQVVLLPSENKVLILGRIKSDPYENRFYYTDIEHLERILKENHIQNCLYAKYDRRFTPDLKNKKKGS